MKFKTADEEIDYLRAKRGSLTPEEFDRLDTLVADRIDAATNALIAIPDDLPPEEEIKLMRRAISKL